MENPFHRSHYVFSASMLMITIVMNLAYELVSQQYISPRGTLPETWSPWLISCWSCLRIYALGKGLVELLQTWGILFIIISQLKSPAEASEAGTLSIPFWCLCQKFLVSFHFKNFCCTKLWETETVSLVPEWNLLLQRAQTLHQPP